MSFFVGGATGQRSNMGPRDDDQKWRDHWLGEMARHPSHLYEIVCVFGDHGHVGTADEILDNLEECRLEWLKRMNTKRKEIE